VDSWGEYWASARTELERHDRWSFMRLLAVSQFPIPDSLYQEPQLNSSANSRLPSAPRSGHYAKGELYLGVSPAFSQNRC